MSVARTFTVDQRGIGRPDYSQPIPIGQYPSPTVFTSTDVAELAARMKSVDTFNRQGNVIFIEDFSGGIRTFEREGSGTGAGAWWDGNHYLSGGYSMKLVAGSDGERYIKVTNRLWFPVLSKLGMELAWTESEFEDLVEGYVTLYCGPDYGFAIQWGFRHDPDTGKTWILTPGGVWEHIVTGVAYVSDYLFTPIKIVVDPINFKYTRMIAGPETIDLSEHTCDMIVDASFARMELMFQMWGDLGANATIYMDNLIVSQNEPINLIE